MHGRARLTGRQDRGGRARSRIAAGVATRWTAVHRRDRRLVPIRDAMPSSVDQDRESTVVSTVATGLLRSSAFSYAVRLCVALAFRSILWITSTVAPITTGRDLVGARPPRMPCPLESSSRCTKHAHSARGQLRASGGLARPYGHPATRYGQRRTCQQLGRAGIGARLPAERPCVLMRIGRESWERPTR